MVLKRIFVFITIVPLGNNIPTSVFAMNLCDVVTQIKNLLEERHGAVYLPQLLPSNTISIDKFYDHLARPKTSSW